LRGGGLLLWHCVTEGPGLGQSGGVIASELGCTVASHPVLHGQVSGRHQVWTDSWPVGPIDWKREMGRQAGLQAVRGKIKGEKMEWAVGENRKNSPEPDLNFQMFFLFFLI
jgi:hypothetical protein